MVKEGTGKVAPAAKLWQITASDLRCIIQEIKTLDRYIGKTDVWSRGMLGGAMKELCELVDTEKPLVAGKCGEYAVLGLATRRFGNVFAPLDFKRRAGGDGGIDLKFFGRQIQVKTRVTAKRNLVRCETPGGKPIPLTGEAHVFCQWDGGNDGYIIRVLGWLHNRHIARMPKASGFGGWQNYVISDESLQPIDSLWATLEPEEDAK